MAGNITNQGRNIMLDRYYNGGTYDEIDTVQLGMCAKTPAVTDTKLYAPIPIDTTGNATIDACDAIAGWSVAGDATSVVQDVAAGNRLEGVASLDLRATHNTGTATYYRTVAGFDGTTDYLFWAVYVNDLTQLTNASDTFTIHLGTGGFTNYNIYNFNYNQLQVGWNALVCDVDNPDSTGGTGATETNIDRIKLHAKITEDLADDDIFMDWIHTYPIANTWDTYEAGYPSFDEGNIKASIRSFISSTESNSYIIREIGTYDNSHTYLASRDTLSSITKSTSITVTFTQTDKITN